jgi:hypothetical protein
VVVFRRNRNNGAIDFVDDSWSAGFEGCRD